MGGQPMGQPGQPGMVMQSGGPTMMMNSNMGQQQVRMQSQVMRGGPGQMELQDGRATTAGMMSQPGNVQGGMMQMQQRMGGPPGMNPTGMAGMDNPLSCKTIHVKRTPELK